MIYQTITAYAERRKFQVPGCWYSISSMDDDILPFLTYIIHSIRGIVPNFSTELVTYIESMDRYIRDEELSVLCSLFINEVLVINSEITLILDDFHQIEHSKREILFESIEEEMIFMKTKAEKA